MGRSGTSRGGRGPRGIEHEQGPEKAVTLRERSEPGPNGPKQNEPRGWGPRGIEQY
jgi:hypothetical protein